MQLINGIASAHLSQSVIICRIWLGVCSRQRDVLPADLHRLVLFYFTCDVHLFLYPQVITQQTAFCKEQVVNDLIGLVDDVARDDNCQ